MILRAYGEEGGPRPLPESGRGGPVGQACGSAASDAGRHEALDVRARAVGGAARLELDLAQPSSGFSQESPSKRAKSRSVVMSTRPYSMASAARWASGTISALPAAGISVRRIPPCFWAGLGNPDRIEREPALHLLPRASHRDSAIEDSRVGDDAHETQEARPGHPHTRDPIQPLVQPGARAFVLGKAPHLCIDEQVGVEQDHRWVSPSAWANTDATSSRSGSRQSPRAQGSVR